MTTTRYVLPGLLLAAALSLTACGTEEAPPPAGATSPAPASPGAQASNAADVAFARGMVPHHEQAVAMSDVVLAADGLDPRVAELATQIKAAQAPEIERLTGWLRQWGADPSDSGGHGGHGSKAAGHEGMPGMMSEGDLADLAAADGAEASRLFLAQMVEHHEGAVAMARTELEKGEHAGAREMARSIVEAQSAEIARMRELLGDL